MSNQMIRTFRRAWGPALLIGLAGCGAPMLSVDDAVVMNGDRVPLVAHVSREHIYGLRSEIERIPVTFLVSGQPVGQNRADDEGRAQVTVDRLEGGPSTFQARARAAGKSLEATGRVFRWQKGRVIMVVDIDHTISQTNYKNLIVMEEVAVSSPVPGARETLLELAKDYYILYLTARPQFLFEKTRDWLTHYGFPEGPIVTAPRVRDAIRQLKYKQTTLAKLRQRWPDLLIGIGNREGDIEAYASNRMLPVIVFSDGEEEHYSDAVVLQNWQFVQRFFAANREALTHPATLAKVIAGQEMILQPLIPFEAAKAHYKPKYFEPAD